ncbi:spermidine hydroxycinnamoyl transferase-like [Forsythia ovata]|uniref:Spermidine hydroxycinnamoyl transferase-like n=1 Tax=Forsythia ovata TaxID=205694 RepID=A0ABD1VKW9_9LAMI
MVTFKATHILKPAKPTPEEIMYLNACDQIKDITHTTTIYFFRNCEKLDNGDVGLLRDSLSEVLVLFYPLAWRLKAAAGWSSTAVAVEFSFIELNGIVMDSGHMLD